MKLALFAALALIAGCCDPGTPQWEIKTVTDGKTMYVITADRMSCRFQVKEVVAQ